VTSYGPSQIAVNLLCSPAQATAKDEVSHIDGVEFDSTVIEAVTKHGIMAGRYTFSPNGG